MPTLGLSLEMAWPLLLNLGSPGSPWEKSGYPAGKARWKGYLDRPPRRGKARRLPADRAPVMLMSQRGPAFSRPSLTRRVSDSSWTFGLWEASEDYSPSENPWGTEEPPSWARSVHGILGGKTKIIV